MIRYAPVGQPLHITQRGNNRGQVFFTPRDGALYLEWLETAAARYGAAVHAYVLMTNHVHLLMTPLKPGAVSKTMQSVGTSYSRYVNTTQNRSGTPWEGRYRSSPITSEAYLLACMRYIELNPVRAGLAAEPGAFRWSSYRRNALGREDTLITPHEVYLSLGPDDASRAAAYHALCAEPLGANILADIRDATDWGVALNENVQAPRRGRPKRLAA
ncbi:MAG: transposase [Rhodospirillaceae bacterium]|nr:transposase [Rhodospirillaceae bacterium]